MTEQVIVDLVSARRQKSSARESFCAISMSTSVSTKDLGSVATTRQPLPQRPCIGSPIADVRPPCPHSTERGFEKALSRRAFQSLLFLVRDGRFSKRPNNIPHDPQSGLRDSLQRFDNLIDKIFFTPYLLRFHNSPYNPSAPLIFELPSVPASLPATDLFVNLNPAWKSSVCAG